VTSTLPGGAVSPSRVLVTGGSGFIGRHVVAALADLGVDVTILDLVAPGDPSLRAVVGDVADPRAVAEALVGCDAVVHLAAVTSVLRSIEAPEATYRTNVAGTATLLEAARLAGVATLVLASTNAVVGPRSAVIDESVPLQPLTPYGATKAAAEMLLSAYDASYGVRAVSLRFSNVYGPGMKLKDSIVARLMRAATSGATIDIYGDGLQVRDYVHVHDVKSAIISALHDVRWRGPLVIGAGRSVSVLELIELARSATGAQLPTVHVAPKAGEMPAVRVTPARAGGLGWTPQVSLADGLAGVWREWAPAGAVRVGG
jgi:UDP-glucose 4-epimerase